MGITGIGETVLDIVFRGGQPQAAVPGGSTFNAMISLGRTLGREFPEVTLRMVTQTGDDPVADIVTTFMKENGVSDEALVRAPGQSTVSLALLDEHSNAHYEFFRDRSLPPFRAPELDFTAGDIVLFGSFFAINPETREQARALIRQARAAGAVVYYDINFRNNHDSAEALPQIEENIALSDIVRGSSEDIAALYGTEDAAAVYEAHIAPLCRHFICTKGARETEVFSPGVHRTYPVPQDTPVVSTIGAGDNFNAGVVYALTSQRAQALRQQETTLSGNAVSTAVAPGLAATALQLTAGDWDMIVPVAHRFSANVVASLYNYVDPDFQP
jgi:fructokinase